MKDAEKELYRRAYKDGVKAERKAVITALLKEFPAEKISALLGFSMEEIAAARDNDDDWEESFWSASAPLRMEYMGEYIKSGIKEGRQNMLIDLCLDNLLPFPIAVAKSGLTEIAFMHWLNHVRDLREEAFQKKIENLLQGDR